MLKKLKNKIVKNTPNVAPLHYSLDVLETNLISGWAYKPEELSHRPKLTVKSNGVLLWSAVAEHYRDDLQKGGFGDGNYAFSITPNGLSLNESITTIDIFFDDQLVAKSIPFELKSIAIADYNVQLDHADVQVVKGWVKKIDDNQHRAKVELKCADVVLAVGCAEEFREDILNASIGDGYYGFSLALSLYLFPSACCECLLYIDGKPANIEPIILEVEQDALDLAVYQHEFLPEVEAFTQQVDTELSQLNEQVVAINKAATADDYALSGQLQVVMSSIAELSVRVNVIERVLTKHFVLK